MSSYRHIEVAPAEHGFGAAITGLSLAQPLRPEVQTEVRKAWLAHQVVCFPAQPLEHAQFERFTQSIGPFGLDPYVAPMPGHPNILELRREATEKAVVFGGNWHSDWSFQDRPPAATLLHAKVVPPVGGDTLYADGYRAFETLSSAMQRLLEQLQGVHSATRPYGPKGLFANEHSDRTLKILPDASADNTRLHPLVRTHGETGRKLLFVNPVYTLAIHGMHAAESEALLGFLFKHMTQDAFVYRHRWHPDMLTIWDNRCVMHNATGGYDGHLRLMHRTTVRGEIPA